MYVCELRRLERLDNFFDGKITESRGKQRVMEEIRNGRIIGQKVAQKYFITNDEFLNAFGNNNIRSGGCALWALATGGSLTL